MKQIGKNVVVLLACLVLLYPIWLSAAVTETKILKSDSKKSAPGKMFCEIRQYKDKPTMFINGMPQFPMAYMSYYPEQYQYKQAGEHGIHVYSLCLSLTDKWGNRMRQRVARSAPGIWLAPDEIDFAAVDKAVMEIIDVDPNAFIFPRIYCDSPAWWDQLYPDDVRTVFKDCPLRQSFSSLQWRNDITDVLMEIVRYVSASKYGDHVIGYMVCAGQTQEFGEQPDFTQCAQQQFRKWIDEKYGSKEREIQRLFGKNIESITIPSEAKQSKADCGNFLDPAKSQLVIDYRRFHSQRCADTAITLCQAVKDASDGRLITGIFYGYTRIWPDWGHLAMRRVLDSNAVDFISNPYSSGGTKSNEWVGNRDFHTFTENRSVQKAGKLFYHEDDIRTSQSRWISQLRPDVDPNGEYNSDGWLGPKKLSDSLELLKTVFAKGVIEGSPNWWFDLWGGWYDNKEILCLFAEMQKVGDESIHLSRKSVAQIAVVLDENSYCYLPNEVSQYGGQFSWVEAQLEQLGKIGASYDFYLLDDLKDLNLSQYRMVVFLNAFVLSKDQRKLIADRCMSENRCLVWLYAPGLIEDNLSVENISSLLGMNFKMDTTHPASTITLKLSEKMITYEGAAVSPFIYVSQGADAACGSTPDGHIVVAEKAGKNCQNLFVAMPPMPWEALQYYARKAGVHLYNEDGVVIFANEHYLAVSVAMSGKRTIRLPREASLKELLVLDNNECFENNTTFEIDIPANTCRIFQMSEAAAISR